MTNTENLEALEALEAQIQNWIEKQNRIAKEIQHELNVIEREERDIDSRSTTPDSSNRGGSIT